MHRLFAGNPVLCLSILSWAVAQLIKFVVVLVLEHRLDWAKILSSGGMPSSHSSTVCALAASLAYYEGFGSRLFAIAAVLAVVVMYDATNIRRAAGEQAKILNYMMENWEYMKPDLFSRKLKELLGHTPLQVLMGALLGIAIGWGGAWLIG